MAGETENSATEIKIDATNSIPETAVFRNEVKTKKSNTSIFAVFVVIIFLSIGSYYFYQKSLSQSAEKIDEVTESTMEENTVESVGDEFKSARTGVDEIELTVTYPNRDLTVTTESITVSGITQKGAEVSVNDKEIVADSEGKFSVKLTLVEGENYVTVVAVSD